MNYKKLVEVPKKFVIPDINSSINTFLYNDFKLVILVIIFYSISDDELKSKISNPHGNQRLTRYITKDVLSF